MCLNTSCTLQDWKYLHISHVLFLILSDLVIVLDDSDSEVGLGFSVDKNTLTKDQKLSPSNQDISDVSQCHKEFEQRLYDLNTSVTLVKKSGESLLTVLKEVSKLNSPHTISSNYSINSESNSTIDLRNHDQVSINSQSSGTQHSDSRPFQHSHSSSMTDLLNKFKDKHKTFNVSAQVCVNVGFLLTCDPIIPA